MGELYETVWENKTDNEILICWLLRKNILEFPVLPDVCPEWRFSILLHADSAPEECCGNLFAHEISFSQRDAIAVVSNLRQAC